MSPRTGRGRELRLHRRIYRAGAVKEALEAFEDFGTFELDRDGDYLVVSIRDPDPDFAAVLPHEIANFALAGTVDRLRL